MPRRQPAQKQDQKTAASNGKAHHKIPELGRLSTPRSQSAALSLAVGAAEIELSNLATSIKSLPTLADLVICRSCKDLIQATKQIEAVLEQSETILDATNRLLKRSSSEGAMSHTKALHYSVGETTAYLHDLTQRAKQLVHGLQSIHTDPPLLTRQQEVTLISEMQRHRSLFWQKVLEVPFVQAAHFNELERVLSGEILPASVIFSGKVDKASNEILRRQAQRAVYSVASILGSQDILNLPASKRPEVAQLLLTAPPSPDIILDSFNKAKALGAELESLQTKLLCRYSSLKSAADSDTLEWPQYRHLRGQLGGDALQARTKLAEMGALFAPYVDLKNYVALSNKGLVLAIVSRSHKMRPYQEDLFQEAHIGLLRSVDRYDQLSGWKFATYASWWIKQAAQRGLSTAARLVQVPTYAEVTLLTITKELSQYPQPLSLEKLAENTQLPERVVATLLPYIHNASRLDTSPAKEGELQLLDMLPDRSTLNPVNEVEQKEDQRAILNILRFLTKKEQEVIQRRFGLNNLPAQTLVEIGAILGITRERVRQIEMRALQKLALRLSYRYQKDGSLLQAD